MGLAPRVAAFLKPVSPRSFSGSKLSSGTFAPPVFLERASSNTSTPCLRQPREKRRKSKYSWEFRMRRLKGLPELLQQWWGIRLLWPIVGDKWEDYDLTTRSE